MDKGIRQPKQQRSIEKKERIIRAAYELFSEKGYYGTVTSDIAKRAGVSTGIVYGYFSDKRDILFYVLKNYIRDTASPVMEYVTSLQKGVTLPEMMDSIVSLAESIHKKNANLHNILHSIAVVDEGINAEFLSLEKHITESATQRFKELGFGSDHLNEKVHLAMNLIQSYTHELIYDRHDFIDYGAMRTVVIDLLVDLFQ
ncbi:MAG: TetR/AcrR family transcriptional regulator [Clostridia bacterium]|nr:TetR/AcrR family transcriptional regulator [Clostridia bacterium]